jgi:hypothetical protein
VLAADLPDHRAVDFGFQQDANDFFSANRFSMRASMSKLTWRPTHWVTTRFLAGQCAELPERVIGLRTTS